jgi:hypothetical protein
MARLRGHYSRLTRCVFMRGGAAICCWAKLVLTGHPSAQMAVRCSRETYSSGRERYAISRNCRAFEISVQRGRIGTSHRLSG